MDDKHQLIQPLSQDGLKSLLMSLPTTRNGNGNTALAQALASSTPPSALYSQYNPALQGFLDGRVRDISMISDRPDIPTLSEVAYAYGNDGVAVDWIKAQLEVVNGFSNVQQRLTTEQLIAIGEQIFGLYPDLNLLEFSLFCGRLRRGKYEKWYGSVDGQKILISLDAFMKDRMNDHYRKLEEEDRRRKEEELSKPGVSPLQLIKDHPGQYPFLEKLYGKGKGLEGLTKKVKPVRRRNNMSKVLAVISKIESIGQRCVELEKYGLQPLTANYDDQSVDILSIEAFLDNKGKVSVRMPEVNARTHSLIEGAESEYQDIRIDDLDESVLLKIISLLTTIAESIKK